MWAWHSMSRTLHTGESCNYCRIWLDKRSYVPHPNDNDLTMSRTPELPVVKAHRLSLGSHPALRSDLRTYSSQTSYFLFIYLFFFIRGKWLFPDERTVPSKSVLQHQRQLSMLAFLVPSTVPSSRRRVSKAEHSRTFTDDLRVWSLTNWYLSGHKFCFPFC